MTLILELEHKLVFYKPGIRRLTSRGFPRSSPQMKSSRPLAKPAAWRRDDQ